MAQVVAKFPPRSVDNHSFGIPDFEPLLNSHQAAQLLDIHHKTLQKLARRGEIHGFVGPNGVKLPLAGAPSGSDGRPAVYGIRPEHFTLSDDGADAEIVVVEPTGSETQVFAKIGGEDVVAVFRERHKFEPGDKVRLRPDPALVHLFDEATGKRLNA